jgi:uncharacterized protein
MNRSALPPEVLFRALPFAAFIGLLAARGVLDPDGTMRWLYALQAGGAALLLAVWWQRYGELRERPRLREWAHAGLAVLAGLAVFGLWISLTAPWMRLGEPATTFVPLDAQGEPIWPLIAVRLAGAVLVVPVMEELFWRSLVMRWIDRRDFLAHPPAQASLYALVASSAVFALAHDLWLAGLIAGLVFGELYRRTGRIWHAILAHAVANLALGLWVVHQRAWGFW